MTGDAGEFVLWGLSVGEYRVSARIPGARPINHAVVISEPGEVVDLEMVFPTQYAIPGRVVDRHGVGQKSIRLLFKGQNDPSETVAIWTGDDGGFVVVLRPNQSYSCPCRSFFGQGEDPVERVRTWRDIAVPTDKLELVLESNEAIRGQVSTGERSHADGLVARDYRGVVIGTTELSETGEFVVVEDADRVSTIEVIRDDTVVHTEKVKSGEFLVIELGETTSHD